MVLDPPIERLYFALMEMVVLEKRTQWTVGGFLKDAYGHPAARELFASIEEMAHTHLGALYERLQTLTDDEDIPATATGLGDSTEIGEFAKLHPVSKALGVTYTIV